MSVILAPTRLFDAVVARFAEDAAAQVPPVTPVPNTFGWQEPAKQRQTSHRVVWVPGDDSSGAAGEIRGAKQPGRNPRPLATLGELVTVYLEASDRSAISDERAQYQAARELFNAWFRAVYLAARGTFVIRSVAWVAIERKQQQYGATLRVLLELDSMLPDVPSAVASTQARGVIGVEELDRTETIETAPALPAVIAATTAQRELAGEETVDSIPVVPGDRVLVMHQENAAENGIYVVASGAWSRAADALDSGFFVHVELGPVNGDAGFELTTPDPIVVGVTPLTFTRVSP